MKTIAYIFAGLLMLNGIRGAIDLSAANDRIVEANAARSFVYDDATPEQQQIWIDRVATHLTKGIRKAYTGPDAPKSDFVSISATTDAARKWVRLDQIVDDEVPSADMRRHATTLLLKGMCKNLMSSTLGEQGITIQMRMLTPSRQNYASADVSMENCAEYVDAG